MGDPDGDFATDEYILPFVNIAYETAINSLMNMCSPFITRQVQVPNVPAGTTDFTPFQVAPANQTLVAGQAGVPLQGLRNPLRLWWKVSAQPENNYAEAEETKDLPFITPANYIQQQRTYWEWRSYKIFVTPNNFAADWLVKGEFTPPPLLKDTDYVEPHPSMASALGFSVAALIGGERVNATYLQNWSAQAIAAFDDIGAELARKEQSTPQRLGRYTGARRRGICW